jgi:UDP-N-acetylglucosamine--N-acetylmuramyl-(pentapeptide) pyrophosphoryl-undecaprenol N-acetylglucosamine transferase
VDLINDSFWNNWQVLIISGKEEHTEVKKMLTNSKYKGIIFVLPYLYEMENAYELADLVICRSGATTVAELTAKGLPAILIPYPYATGDHQLYNARYLEKEQAAVVITQQDLSEDKLATEISRLLLEEESLKTLARNSKKLGNRKAAEEIINSIYQNIKKEEIL